MTHNMHCELLIPSGAVPDRNIRGVSTQTICSVLSNTAIRRRLLAGLPSDEARQLYCERGETTDCLEGYFSLVSTRCGYKPSMETAVGALRNLYFIDLIRSMSAEERGFHESRVAGMGRLCTCIDGCVSCDYAPVCNEYRVQAHHILLHCFTRSYIPAASLLRCDCSNLMMCDIITDAGLYDCFQHQPDGELRKPGWNDGSALSDGGTKQMARAKKIGTRARKDVTGSTRVRAYMQRRKC